ncbi:MAG: HAD family hydrolase [Aureispira sp.]
MQKENLIVFDIDGTLTDSVALHQNAFRAMLSLIGIEQSPTRFHSFKHHTDSFIVKELYELDRKEAFPLSKIIAFEKGLTEKICAQPIKEIKGALQLLQQIENHPNYGVCFATGSLLRPAQYKLEAIGLQYEQALLVASDEIYERKNIVAQAIQQAKAFYKVSHFNRIIAVGDGLWDLQAAQNLQLEFIGVGLANKQVLEDHGASIVLEDLTTFPLL